MLGRLIVSRERFLALAQKLALATSCAGSFSACAGGSDAAPPPLAPLPKPSVTSAAAAPAETVDPMPMPSDGPCRCSWDPNASKAPRVCKKGEENYEGIACLPRAPSFE